MPVLITGHRNPDTDSIAAAMGYAQLKNRLDPEQIHQAVRLGQPNKESRFVLQRFGLEPPPLIHTVKTQVRDLAMDPPVAGNPKATLRETYAFIRENAVRMLPILDEGQLVGLVTPGQLAYHEFGLEESVRVDTSLGRLARVLDGELAGSNPGEPVCGELLLACHELGELRELARGRIVLAGSRRDFARAAAEGAACVIVTEIEPEPGPAPVIRTPLEPFLAARRAMQSVAIASIMVPREKIVGFQATDYVDDIRETMLSTRYRSYPVLDHRGGLEGLISRYHLIQPRRKRVILVDHNELAQSVPGLEQAEVVEIIDHHRIADIQTGSPILFRNEPVGSSSTIVAGMFREHGFEPEREIAGLLLAAILSDTVLFRSPTATGKDRDVAEWLSGIAGVSYEDLGREMFAAATSLEGKNIRELFGQDFKEFKLADRRIGIAQINAMDIAPFAPMYGEILSYMDDMARVQGYDLLMLMLTDILKAGSEILMSGKRLDIIAKAFGVDTESRHAFLPGVLSRKKQIIPPISAIID